MAGPIRFYLDFASPYAYCALPGIERLAAQHDRELEWRPIMVWAVLKAQGIPPPMQAPARVEYFVADMKRSAAFHGLPYRHPTKFPLSAHRAARLYHALAAEDEALARAVGREFFTAFLTRDEDISDADVLTAIAARHGVSPETARAAMDEELGRERLADTIDAAVADGVVGSPFFIVDGEGFFGADRLPQIEWRLAGSAATSVA